MVNNLTAEDCIASYTFHIAPTLSAWLPNSTLNVVFQSGKEHQCDSKRQIGTSDGSRNQPFELLRRCMRASGVTAT